MQFPPKPTVTAKLYRWVLIHKLRPAIAKKQPELLRKGPSSSSFEILSNVPLEPSGQGWVRM